MKYEVANYVKAGHVTEIKVGNYTQDQLEEMEKTGGFFCPGKDCNAKLCLVHHSKNGGRTYFLKAIDDNKHGANCEYKIGNYKAISVREPENGYFTEEQINNHVKTVDRDVSEPIEKKKSRKRDKKENITLKKQEKEDKQEDKQIRKTANTGRVVYGEEGIEGIKGRMSRTYTIQHKDVGSMKTIYGNAKQVKLDEYGQLHIAYKDERLGNIDVVAGPIIEHNYPTLYPYLYLTEAYFNANKEKKDVRVTAGGLITEKKGRITMELLTDGGLRIDGKSIKNLIVANMNKAG